MKSNLTPIPAEPATPSPNRKFKLPAPASLPGAAGGLAQAVPPEILLQLGAIYAIAEMTGMLGQYHELTAGRGVQAGLVAALHAFLPAAQFRDVMIQWDVDAIKLSELFHLASYSEPIGA